MLPALLLLTAPGPDLTTIGEKSQLTRTGRYDEVVRLCRDYPLKYPGKVACQNFGTTPEGRPMLSLVASDDGVLEPDAARARKRPVILVQGGIHAGEIDGKDAGFLALRAFLDGTAAPGVLAKVTWVFVPVFNVDGHERFGANNRPNQRGPSEMGWRTTAQNYNLNRDYAKTDAPEMQAMIRLLVRWDPVLYVDLHVTDGADFQHDIAILLDPADAGLEPLRTEGKALRDGILARLTKQGNKPVAFYPSFEVDDDPSSGFALGLPPPRFAQGYWAARDRMSLLVETHSWKTYAVRVEATRRAVIAIAELAKESADRWRAAADAHDAVKVGGTQVVLSYENDKHVTTIDFLGYAYKREPSPVSGRMRVTYDPSKPTVWKVPYLDHLVPRLTLTAPKAGYYLPAQATVVADRLAVHGFRTFRTAKDEERTAMVHRATEYTFGAKSYEGRQTLAVKGEWKPEKVRVPAGTIWIPIDQPGSRLLLHLLEPGGPDSFLAWGFFNGFYEQKEYMESYVAEAWAEALLAKDPEVKKEFEAKLADPAFAADGNARLDFFYKKHASWDTSLARYPVLRADTPPSSLAP